MSATDEGSAPADGSLERQLDIGQDIKAIIWFEEGTSRERMYEVFLELVPPGELFPFAAEFVPEQRAILVGSMSDDVDASSLADLETRATQYVEVAEFEHV